MGPTVLLTAFAGCRQLLRQASLRSTMVDGQGLNITVQSYMDTLDFGLVSCRELVPDLDNLADYILDDLAGLADAAGVEATIADSD